MPQEKYLGRIVKEKHIFKEEGTFESLWAAERWCKENNYDEGSMSSPYPIGLMKGKYVDIPWKWKNMNAKERNLVDGVIVSNDFREGEVIVYIFN